MSKILDWDSISDTNFDEKRRKNNGQFSSFKEAMAKSYEKMEASQAQADLMKAQEPGLRQALLEAMVNRSPIRVLAPIQNPTESLNGLQKSEEDDGFYNAIPSSSQSESIGSFQEIMEIIPAGTTLIFKSLDKQLGQFVFKSSNGQEYSIYDKNVILFQGQQIQNPGLYGLLYNTDLSK